MELQEIHSRFAVIREQIFRGKIKSFCFGEHQSRASGPGMDFKEISEWNPNEPLRRIDWGLSFASWPEKAYKVETIEPRNAPLILAVDVTPSILLQIRDETNKSRLLLELIGMLGFDAEHFKDPLGICFFSDKVDGYLRPKVGRANVFNSVKLIFDKVKELEQFLNDKNFRGAGRRTNINEAVYFISARVKRQCSVVILSDFSDVINSEYELDFWSLESLAARYNWNVMAIFLDDPEEFNWKRTGGIVTVKNIESGKRVMLKSWRISKIRSEFIVRREALKQKLQEHGISSTVLSYGEHFNDLARFLSQRKSTHR